jgi:hypothetical protein
MAPATDTPATELRSIWRCERYDGFHIGGIDLVSNEDGTTWTASCGAVCTGWMSRAASCGRRR